MFRVLFLFALLVASGVHAQYTTDHPIDTWGDGMPVQDVRTFDVDGDGDQDVFVNRYGLSSSGSFAWYRNDGSGVFAPAVTISSGSSYAEDFDLGDLDGDGDLDVVYNALPGGTINVRLFSGGAFAPPQTWGTVPGWARYLRLMQVDPLNNSALDLVVHTEYNRPHVLLNTGGAFGTATEVGSGGQFLGPDAMEVGDLSGNLGDILVQGASHLWLHTLRYSDNGYYWQTTNLGYCDDHIQVTDVDGYEGDNGRMEIGRTNSDTLYYTDVWDSDGFIFEYTAVVDIGLAGPGTFGHADCDEPIDILVDHTNGDGEQVPLLRRGYYPDGFDFTAAEQSSGLPLNGSWPVLVDLDEDGLNDLLRVENGSSFHWYTNSGPEAPLVTLAAFADTLAYNNVTGCFEGYPLSGGAPSDGYWGGNSGVDDDEYYPVDGAGDFPITYHYTDNNGCHGSATRYIHVIDQVETIPDSLTTCTSNTPYQLSSIPVHAAWLSDNYVTTDGLLDISYPYAAAIQCMWTDVTGCPVYGSMPAVITPGEMGDAHIYGWEGPDILCTNSEPVQIYRTLGDGDFELVPFDPAAAGVGTYTFIGYADTSVPADCYVNDTLNLQVLAPPAVDLDPFTDTLANACEDVTYWLPTGPNDYWTGTGVDWFENYWFDPYGLLGDIPLTYHHYDQATGCVGTATQTITVIDSVTIVPDPIVTCPQPDSIQVLTYPNAVWGSNEIPGGLVDVSFPYSQHYLCYWEDVLGCGVYGELNVTVNETTYGYAVTNCECDVLCETGPVITVYTSQPDGSELTTDFDPILSGVGTYMFVGYAAADQGGLCTGINDTLYIEVVPTTVDVEAFLDTLANACPGFYPLSDPDNSDWSYWTGPGVEYEGGYGFDPLGLTGDIPLTVHFGDAATGCLGAVTQPITVIDSVVVVPDPIVTCPQPDSIQVLTYPNAVWGSNEIPGGLVDVSYPYSQHYLCYWTDVLGCGVYGELNVTVNEPAYGYAVTSCECSTLCTNSDPITVYTSQTDGGELQTPFDPAALGVGTYEFIGYGDASINGCAVNDTLHVQVVGVPTVSLDPFTDLLADGCQNGYALSGGLPAGGSYYGNGVVDGDFYPLGLAGPNTITYQYTDANGCGGEAQQTIDVIDDISATPASVSTCPDTDPVQLASSPDGAIWSGSPFVAPGGSLDVATPNNDDAIGTWTDVTGCALNVTVPVTVYPIGQGYAYVDGVANPVTLCESADPVTVVLSLADGGENSFIFDPAAEGPGEYGFIGEAPDGSPCPAEAALTITVTPAPVVSLVLPYDQLCVGTAAVLSGGLPVGGIYSNGGMLDVAAGVNTVTYTWEADGCSGSAIDEVTGVVVTEANGYDSGTPTLCPDDDPLVFAPSIPGGVWSGSVVSGVFDPANGTGGPWSYTITDDADNTCGMGGTINALPFTPATLEASATTVCTSGSAVTIQGTNALGGTITGPIVPDDPFDPFNPSGTFDPSIGTGTYVFSMDVAGDAQGCAWSLDLTVTVVDVPEVTVDTFTDTLLNGCSGTTYPLVQGSPEGGIWAGPGVSDNAFSAFGLAAGEYPLTYFFSAGPECAGQATGTIHVIQDVSASPYDTQTPLYACQGTDPVQLTTVPSGAVWSGAAVTPQGYVDMSAPFNGILTWEYTDAAGCSSGNEMQAIISPFSQGSVTIAPPGSTVVCLGSDPFDVTVSTASNGDSTFTFDPAVEGIGIHPITGVAPLQTDPPGCYFDAVVTIQVMGTAVDLNIPAELDTVDGESPAFTLTGGSPAGGTWSGNGVSGDQFDPAQAEHGDNIIAYSFTDDDGCTGTATDTIHVVVPDAIGEQGAAGLLQVWPVPARDALFIGLPRGAEGVVLVLYDIRGREAARTAAHAASGTAPLRWDIGLLANGSYTLRAFGRPNLAPARVLIAH